MSSEITLYPTFSTTSSYWTLEKKVLTENDIIQFDEEIQSKIKNKIIYYHSKTRILLYLENNIPFIFGFISGINNTICSIHNIPLTTFNKNWLLKLEFSGFIIEITPRFAILQWLHKEKKYVYMCQHLFSYEWYKIAICYKSTDIDLLNFLYEHNCPTNLNNQYIGDYIFEVYDITEPELKKFVNFFWSKDKSKAFSKTIIKDIENCNGLDNYLLYLKFQNFLTESSEEDLKNIDHSKLSEYIPIVSYLFERSKQFETFIIKNYTEWLSNHSTDAKKYYKWNKLKDEFVKKCKDWYTENYSYIFDGIDIFIQDNSELFNECDNILFFGYYDDSNVDYISLFKLASYISKLNYINIDTILLNFYDDYDGEIDKTELSELFYKNLDMVYHYLFYIIHDLLNSNSYYCDLNVIEFFYTEIEKYLNNYDIIIDDTFFLKILNNSKNCKLDLNNKYEKLFYQLNFHRLIKLFFQLKKINFSDQLLFNIIKKETEFNNIKDIVALIKIFNSNGYWLSSKQTINLIFENLINRNIKSDLLDMSNYQSWTVKEVTNCLLTFIIKINNNYNDLEKLKKYEYTNSGFLAQLINITIVNNIEIKKELYLNACGVDCMSFFYILNNQGLLKDIQNDTKKEWFNLCLLQNSFDTSYYLLTEFRDIIILTNEHKELVTNNLYKIKNKEDWLPYLN